jgi:hypothetical protein
VEQSQAQEFSEGLSALYAGQFGIVPQIHVCHASDGAHRMV